MIDLGYRIDYRPVKKLRNLHSRRNVFASLTGIFFLMFLLSVYSLLPDDLSSQMITVDTAAAAAAAAAFDGLCQQLQERVSLISSFRECLHSLFSGIAP